MIPGASNPPLLPALLSLVGGLVQAFLIYNFTTLGHTGGKPLLELNRVLRPGGYYIWSATPVYRRGKRDEDDWNG